LFARSVQFIQGILSRGKRIKNARQSSIVLQLVCESLAQYASSNQFCIRKRNLLTWLRGLSILWLGCIFLGGVESIGSWQEKDALKCLCLFSAFFPNILWHMSLPLIGSSTCDLNFILICGEGLSPLSKYKPRKLLISLGESWCSQGTLLPFYWHYTTWLLCWSRCTSQKW
jgi:hypothetical protein